MAEQPEPIDEATALNFLHGFTIEDASIIEDPNPLQAVVRGSILRLCMSNDVTLLIRGHASYEDADLIFEVASDSAEENTDG